VSVCDFSPSHFIYCIHFLSLWISDPLLNVFVVLIFFVFSFKICVHIIDRFSLSQNHLDQKIHPWFWRFVNGFVSVSHVYFVFDINYKILWIKSS
jgi:hypothetical protein